VKLASATPPQRRLLPESAPAIEIVLPLQGDATQGAFGGVAVDLKQSVVDTAHQGAPAPVSIADGGRGFDFGRKLAQRFLQSNPKNRPAKLAEGNDSGIAYFTAIVI